MGRYATYTEQIAQSNWAIGKANCAMPMPQKKIAQNKLQNFIKKIAKSRLQKQVVWCKLHKNFGPKIFLGQKFC